jgi:hypothetical protein
MIETNSILFLKKKGNFYQIGMGGRSKIIKSLSFFFFTTIGMG